MLIAWIIFGIAILSFFIVLARRFPQAAMLDVDTIAAERQKLMKDKLVTARLARGAKAVGARVGATFAPVGKVVSSGAKNMYDRVLSLEKKYQEERRTLTKPLKEDERVVVAKLVTDAQDLLDEGRYGEAEQAFIKVVAQDARNVSAYKGLARIYLETKQFDQAKETVDFLLKLKPGDAESFAMRSEIAYSRGDLHVAEEEMQKAMDANAEQVNYIVDLAQILYEEKKFCEAASRMRMALERDENNPKYLDFLVDASILCPDKAGAEKSLERLRAVNPENQKIGEFLKRVGGMQL
jgi:Flp pilus assembly protein TadD